MGSEEGAGTFHEQAASAIPFICRWECLVPRGQAARPPLAQWVLCPRHPAAAGGAAPLCQVRGVSHGHGPRSRGWGQQRGLAAPEHLVPARGWGEVGQPVRGQPMVLRRLPKCCIWGFWERQETQRHLFCFSVSRGFNGEHCAERSFPLHLQSPVPVGPAAVLGSPGLAVGKSHGGNNPRVAMLSR